jgi:hypothetical protein
MGFANKERGRPGPVGEYSAASRRRSLTPTRRRFNASPFQPFTPGLTDQFTGTPARGSTVAPSLRRQGTANRSGIGSQQESAVRSAREGRRLRRPEPRSGSTVLMMKMRMKMKTQSFGFSIFDFRFSIEAGSRRAGRRCAVWRHPPVRLLPPFAFYPTLNTQHSTLNRCLRR